MGPDMERIGRGALIWSERANARSGALGKRRYDTEACHYLPVRLGHSNSCPTGFKRRVLAYTTQNLRTFAIPGDVLVFIHGFSNTPDQWLATLSMLTPALTLRATSVTLPGHIEGPAADVTWDRNLAIVREQIVSLAQSNSVRMSDITLVGYSLGARVALGLLAHDFHQEPVGGAVLISCHPGLTDDAQRQARRQSDAQWADILQRRPLAEFAAAWTAQAIFASQQMISAEAKHLRQQARLRHHGPSLADAMIGMSLGQMPSYWQWLASKPNAKRVTWVVGVQDTKFVHLADRLHCAQPALKVHSIANAGHDPTLEQPCALAEALTRILSD
jgi:2-succinyl-6-hydroxy-2,4-cyclohexadiene-1-carboxylate synthase